MTDWVPDSRPVDAELSPDFPHADYVPTVVSEMEGYSVLGRVQAATKELWIAMAKATR